MKNFQLFFKAQAYLILLATLHFVVSKYKTFLIPSPLDHRSQRLLEEEESLHSLLSFCSFLASLLYAYSLFSKVFSFFLPQPRRSNFVLATMSFLVFAYRFGEQNQPTLMRMAKSVSLSYSMGSEKLFSVLVLSIIVLFYLVSRHSKNLIIKGLVTNYVQKVSYRNAITESNTEKLVVKKGSPSYVVESITNTFKPITDDVFVNLVIFFFFAIFVLNLSFRNRWLSSKPLLFSIGRVASNDGLVDGLFCLLFNFFLNLAIELVVVFLSTRFLLRGPVNRPSGSTSNHSLKCVSSLLDDIKTTNIFKGFFVYRYLNYIIFDFEPLISRLKYDKCFEKWGSKPDKTLVRARIKAIDSVKNDSLLEVEKRFLGRLFAFLNDSLAGDRRRVNGGFMVLMGEGLRVLEQSVEGALVGDEFLEEFGKFREILLVIK